MRLTFNSTLADPSADIKKGIITGIQIARIGEARGHSVVETTTGYEIFRADRHPPEAARQVVISSATLDSLIACAGERVKCLMNHSDDINEVAGVFKNFHRDGESVRADLHLLRSSKHHDYLLELSEECPDGFGVSINFYPYYAQMELNNTKKTVACICEKLVSCDLVTEPAATDGLFQVGEQSDKTTQKKMDETPEEKNKPASEEVANIAANAAKEAVTEALAPVTEMMTAMSERMTKLETPEKPEEKSEEEQKLEKENAEKAEAEKMSAMATAVAGAVITKLGIKQPVSPSVENADDTTKLSFSEHVDHIAKTEGKSNIEATKVVMGKFPDKHKSHLAALTK